MRLHVYDFSVTRRVAALNAVSRAVTSCGGALGDGVGAFHGGIEVHGVEWSYGSTESGEATGIFGCSPRRNSSHSYRSTVELGRCVLSKGSVDRVLTAMARVDCDDDDDDDDDDADREGSRAAGQKDAGLGWHGTEYDMLARNCCHFCAAFVALLGPGVAPCPPWLNGLATAAHATLCCAAPAPVEEPLEETGV